MKYQIDEAYLIRCFRDLVNTPSPVGYYVQLNPVIEKYACELGYKVTYDNKSTAYITLDGQDNSKTVMIGSHVDTIGFVVRRVESNGVLRVRALGGINYSNAEGETVTVHIGRLRKRFEGWSEFQIESVRGLGYKAVKKI